MSQPESALYVAPCSRKAAEIAVRNWHYSAKMPAGRLVHYGVWESGRFVGAIIFGHGGAPQINMPFGVAKHEICELVRVALRPHKCSVSKMLSVAMRLLRRAMPNMKLIVSYADTEQGHSGGIYKAGNWLYVGSITKALYVIRGKREHSRNVEERFKGKTPLLAYLRTHVDSHAKKIATPPKHKFVMPLDATTRKRVQSMSKPYPKRATSIDNDAVAFQAAEGGASPTVALHSISSGEEAEGA